jgi:hypothetical protein
MPVNRSSHRTENGRSRFLSFIKRAVASHWFERILFVVGSLLICSSEQIHRDANIDLEQIGAERFLGDRQGALIE